MKELILTLLFISSWAINIAVAQDYSCSFLNAIMTDVRDKGGNYNTYFKVLDGKIKDSRCPEFATQDKLKQANSSRNCYCCIALVNFKAFLYSAITRLVNLCPELQTQDSAGGIKQRFCVSKKLRKFGMSTNNWYL